MVKREFGFDHRPWTKLKGIIEIALANDVYRIHSLYHMEYLILRSKYRRVVSVFLLFGRHVFRRSSLGLEHLSSLDLLFGHNFFSGLGLLKLLLEALLLGLGIFDLLDLLGVEDIEDFSVCSLAFWTVSLEIACFLIWLWLIFSRAI